MQAPGCRQAKLCDLADDSTKALLMQTFLNQGQDIGVSMGFDEDHPVWVKAHLHETGGEQIPACQTPENRTFEAGENAGREQGGRPNEFAGRAMLDHLVQSA